MTDTELDVADSFERVFPVPTVVADWDEVLDRAGARNGTPTRLPSRWRVVAIAVTIVAGAALLVTPALGIGDRLLSLIQGKPSRLDVQAPSWSPDGRTIVFVSWRDGNGEVYAMDADSSSPRNLTQDPAKDVRPVWSPDGRRIAFVSGRDRQSEIYVMNADGSGKRNLTRNRAKDDLPTWSPDGRRIAFVRATRSKRGPLGVIRFWGYELYVVNADGSGLRRLPLDPRSKSYSLLHPLVWSPDGRTIHSGPHLIRTDGRASRRLRSLAREDLRVAATEALRRAISHNTARGKPVHPVSRATLGWLEEAEETHAVAQHRVNQEERVEGEGQNPKRDGDL